MDLFDESLTQDTRKNDLKGVRVDDRNRRSASFIMNDRKSDALLSFERHLAELESAVGRGEIGTQEMLIQYQRLKNTAIETMTESEREDFQRLELDAHRIGADLLAEHGLPVPGNDPNRPN